MGSSVAGQIRIDLISQTAQFTPGLREGRKELGSFREEFERLSKSFDSKKNVATRIGAEKDAWKAATTDMRLEMERSFGKNRYDTLAFNSLGMMNARNDRAEDNRIRWRSMLPWGNSLRTELSREAAETAALLGKETRNLSREFARSAQELAGAGMGAMGYGGLFGRVAGFAASPLGAATIGIAAVAGTIAHAVREHDQLAREVRVYAQQFGSSSESASRLLGSGIDETSIARIQRAFSQKSEQQQRGFAALGLSPDALSAMPVEKALQSINQAFERIPNAADRAKIAFELFGRGGYGTIGTLERMQEKLEMLDAHEIIHPDDIERVKAWDKALDGAGDTISSLSLRLGKLFGTHSGFGTHMARGIELLGPLLTGDWKALDASLFRFQREDFNVEHANRIAMLKAGVDRSTAFGMESQYESGKLTQEEYDQQASEAIDAIQANTRRIEQEADNRSSAVKKLQDLNDELFGLQYGAEAVKRKKFEQDLRELGIPEVSRAGLTKSGPQTIGEYMYEYDAAIARQKQEKVRQEREKERQRDLERKEKQEADEAAEFFRRQDDFEKKLRSPEQVFRDELAQLIDFRGNLSTAEFARGQREVAGKYASELGGAKEISPVGMLAAGSAELHSIIAKANQPDPKVALQQETNRLLGLMLQELAQERGEVLQ